jgi:hypothetical protein
LHHNEKNFTTETSDRVRKICLRVLCDSVPSLLWPGLPDGFFSKQIPIWVNFWGPQMGKYLYIFRWENIYIFYGHLDYFKDIWDILWPFGTFSVHWVHFSGFGTMNQEKSGNPVCDKKIPRICCFVRISLKWSLKYEMSRWLNI